MAKPIFIYTFVIEFHVMNSIILVVVRMNDQSHCFKGVEIFASSSAAKTQDLPHPSFGLTESSRKHQNFKDDITAELQEYRVFWPNMHFCHFAAVNFASPYKVKCIVHSRDLQITERQRVFGHVGSISLGSSSLVAVFPGCLFHPSQTLASPQDRFSM